MNRLEAISAHLEGLGTPSGCVWRERASRSNH